MTALLKQIKEHYKVFTENTFEKFAAVLKACAQTFSRHNLQLNPSKINHVLTGGLILLTAGIGIYWFMHVLQIPEPPDGTNGSKATALASNQNTSPAHNLFGEKPIATQNIFLRGIVITSKSSAGLFDGYAIFEINGKPTNAIAIGDGLGNGLTLKSIKPESAILLYQGQEMEFELSKNKSKLPATNKNH